MHCPCSPRMSHLTLQHSSVRTSSANTICSLDLFVSPGPTGAFLSRQLRATPCLLGFSVSSPLPVVFLGFPLLHGQHSWAPRSHVRNVGVLWRLPPPAEGQALSIVHVSRICYPLSFRDPASLQPPRAGAWAQGAP